MKFIIVTGLSGAGKTTALKVLENIGFFCVDNLPSSLLTKFADLCFQGNNEFSKVAVGIDSRGRSFFNTLESALEYMDKNNYSVDILYLHCDKEALVNRYNFTRSIHPLSEEGGTLLECIEKENEILESIRKHSTFLIDTTKMQSKNIKMTLERLYGSGKEDNVKVYISSFGFKRGIPVDADYVFDLRFLPNPYNVQELRAHCGLEECVKDYLKAFPDFEKTVDMICEQLKFILPMYSVSGKRELFYAVGCTGGFHRSVAVADEVAKRLGEEGFSVVSDHRDLELEGEKWKNLLR